MITREDDQVTLKEETASWVTDDDRQKSTSTCTVPLDGASLLSLSRNAQCRLWLRHLVESYKFQVTIVSLVILDCLIVIGELLADIQSFELQQDNQSVSQVLHAVSLSIISLFIVEVCIKLYAFGSGFFRCKREIFDAVVVFAILALEIAFHRSNDAVNGVGLIVALRLWRVVRILNGVVMSVKVQAERRLRCERYNREMMEQELTKFQKFCAVQKKEIEVLRSLLNQHGIVAPDSNIIGEEMESKMTDESVNEEVYLGSRFKNSSSNLQENGNVVKSDN